MSRSSSSSNNSLKKGDHYPHIDELTKYEKDKIAELRSKVSETLATYPEYDTDFSLLRWLMGWDYKIDEIVPKLETAVSWLVALGLPEQPMMSPPDVNSYIRNLSVSADFFPGGLMSQDDDGNVIYMQAICGVHPKSLVKAGAVSELFKLCIVETELAFKIIRKEEAARGRKLGVKLLIDLDGFNMDLLYTPTLKVYLNLLTIMQATFPDFARKIVLFNCPMMMQTVYAMISPVLSKQTREKVVFLGNNWKEDINNEIGAHNNMKHWGGTMEHKNPKGDLRLGGKVPEKLWYIPEENPHDDKDQFTKITVGARTKGEVRMKGENGKTFHWIWRVSSGDLDFSIEKDNKEIFPKFRIMTDFHPEIGKFKCPSDGEFVFLFDNSHATFFGKDVKYKIWLE